MSRNDHGRPRRSRPLGRAARPTAEPVEPRRLLSGASPTLPGGVAGLPAGVSARAVGGRFDVSVTPTAGRSTPTSVRVVDSTQTTTAAAMTTAGTAAPLDATAPTGLTPAQVRHAYGVDRVLFGSVQGDGTGQTIAIIDAYDWPTAAADLHAFDLSFGLPDPPSFAKVNQTGGTALPGVDPSAKGYDWELDEAVAVEWAHAMAPAASILLVEANSGGDADLITAAAGYARTVPGVTAVCMTFARPESSADATLNATFTTPAGHAGVTFVAATGDYGAPAAFPACSPNVVAVGGTTLATTGTDGTYGSEAAWSGSGGGISAYQSQPSYQAGVVTQSTTRRTVPDLAFDADPSTGVAVCDSYDFGPDIPWQTVGGTSLSAACVAGVVAVADQGRAAVGRPSLDGPADALPRLYTLPAAGPFHDVTTGINVAYAARAGYDLATGRGSPVADRLVAALAAAGPYVSATSPTGYLTAAPSAVTFTFSRAMDPASFDPAADVDAFTAANGAIDLRSSITGYTWASPTALQVSFAAPASATGVFAMTIGPDVRSADGFPMDQNADGVAGQPGVDAVTATFDVDPVRLAVASASPAANGLLSGAAPTLALTFNQPVDPATVQASDLTLTHATATAVAVSADGLTVTFTLGNFTVDGSLTATLPAGSVAKPDGTPLRSAYSATFTADAAVLPLPTPLTALGPTGSLAYAAPATPQDYIYRAGETHSYTVALDAGLQFSVGVNASIGGLRPTVALVNPAGRMIAAAAGPTTSGGYAALQAVPIPTAGTYTVIVGGANSTTGYFYLYAQLNAVFEQQLTSGVSHLTAAAAQSLDGAFVPVDGGGRRADVPGHLFQAISTTATLLSDTFESGLGGLTLNNAPANGLWHLSTGRAADVGHSASTSLYFGAGETANGGGTYDTGARAAGYATAPAVTIPSTVTAATAKFNYILQTQGSTAADKAQLQVSTDGGTTFTTVASYNGTTAESSSWKPATADLTAYKGKTVVLPVVVRHGRRDGQPVRGVVPRRRGRHHPDRLHDRQSAPANGRVRVHVGRRRVGVGRPRVQRAGLPVVARPGREPGRRLHTDRRRTGRVRGRLRRPRDRHLLRQGGRPPGLRLQPVRHGRRVVRRCQRRRVRQRPADRGRLRQRRPAGARPADGDDRRRPVRRHAGCRSDSDGGDGDAVRRHAGVAGQHARPHAGPVHDERGGRRRHHDHHRQRRAERHAHLHDGGGRDVRRRRRVDRGRAGRRLRAVRRRRVDGTAAADRRVRHAG